MREPDPLDAAIVLMIVMAAMLCAIAGVAWLHVPGGLAQVFQQVAFFAVPMLYARKAGYEAAEANGFVRLGWRPLLLVLLASLGSLWLLNGLTHLQTEVLTALGLLKKAEAEIEQIRQGIEGARKQGALPALSLLVLIPPLCEETFVRGLVFRGIRRRFGPAVAILVTAGVFAALHEKLVQVGLMVFLGCYFGLLVHLTGSLWSSVIAHAVNNLAVLTLTWIYGPELPDFVGPWWMYVFSALLFGAAITLLVLDRRTVRD